MRCAELCKAPNILTLSRILVTVPAGVLLFGAETDGAYSFHFYAAAFFLCGYAAVTDFLDGYLARKNNETSALGAALDPVADKLFSIWILYALAAPIWLILLMISRDLWVTTLRTLWKKSITTSILAKWKTALLFVFVLTTIFLRMYAPEINPWNVSEWHYVNFTTVMTVLVIYTGTHYTFLTFKK